MIEITEKLDGFLLSLLRHLIDVSQFKANELIKSDSLKMYPVAQVIIAAREAGCHWIWAESQIRKDKELNKYVLPSIDIAGYFGDGENNNNVKELFIKSGIEVAEIDWDTESSSWYPRFETRLGAIKFITEIDTFFDKKYLDDLKKYRLWD